MHNFVANEDRRPVFLQGKFDDIDRTDDAGTKPARPGQNYFHFSSSSQLHNRTCPIQGLITNITPKSQPA